VDAVQVDLSGPVCRAATAKETHGAARLVPAVQRRQSGLLPAGMARDMGDGASVYVLSAKRHLARRLPLFGTFEPAPKESIGTVADQDAYFRNWLDARRR
jgi:hypothetical protein